MRAFTDEEQHFLRLLLALTSGKNRDRYWFPDALIDGLLAEGVIVPHPAGLDYRQHSKDRPVVVAPAFVPLFLRVGGPLQVQEHELQGRDWNFFAAEVVASVSPLTSDYLSRSGWPAQVRRAPRPDNADGWDWFPETRPIEGWVPHTFRHTSEHEMLGVIGGNLKARNNDVERLRRELALAEQVALELTVLQQAVKDRVNQIEAGVDASNTPTGK